MKKMIHVSLLFVVVGLAGCADKVTKKAVYDALSTRQCIDDTDVPNCESDRPSYEEFQRQRQEVPN